MKILYYIEPWIEYEKPIWKKDYIWWFGDFSKKLSEITKVESFFLLNEGCSSFYNEYNRCESKFAIIYQEELLKIAKNHKEMLIKWQQNKWACKEMHGMKKLISKKLKDFIPDFIFTITPVPFLEKLFPKALIIHRDGMHIREPFPDEFTSFDPFGIYTNSIWVKNSKQIEKTSLKQKEKKFLQEFRKIYLTKISNKNPFKSIVKKEKSKFDYILLFPLQSPHHFNFYQFYNESIFNLVYDIFLKVDKRIGIIVTQHPDDKVLNNEATAFLKNKFKNFIYPDNIENFCSPSQFLSEYIDGMINISSGLAFFALMQQKPMFNPTNSHFEPFSENCKLEDIYNYLKNKSYKPKDNFLFFFLSKYNFNYCYMHNPEWLKNRLYFLKENKKKIKKNIDKFPLIDDNLQTLLENFKKFKREVKLRKN
jgi:O-antigen biosynthesis protein